LLPFAGEGDARGLTSWVQLHLEMGRLNILGSERSFVWDRRTSRPRGGRKRRMTRCGGGGWEGLHALDNHVSPSLQLAALYYEHCVVNYGLISEEDQLVRAYRGVRLL
jgi:hypothetical protein